MDIAAAADRHYDALIDAQTRAEQVISRHVRDAIEAAGCMPDGRSLEWHGADIEQFAGAVLRALASGDSITDQWAAIREARDRHIIDPITDTTINTDGADLAREFEQTGIEDRARLNMARIVASARMGVVL